MPNSSHNFDGGDELTPYTSSEVNNPDLAGQSDIFFAAVGMTRMPMVVTNPNLPDHPIVFANEAFAEMTGYSLDEIVNRNCRFLQGPDTCQESVTQIRENIKKEDHTTLEILNYRKDGTPFWNALFISPIYDQNEKLVYFFGSQLDVTRRRNAESALHQAQKMEAIGQLTGGLAHDFNNLLTLILGNAKLLRKIVSQDGALLKYLDRINDAALKGQKLTQQMLAFARKQKLEAKPIDLNRTVRGLNNLLAKTLGSEIEIHIQLAPDIWITKVDAIQFELALINILVNARDAVENVSEKKVFITIENRDLSAEDAENIPDASVGKYVEISIRDTGSGMTQDVLTRVTEPFFTTKDIGRGSGLGLSQVYGFMRQSRGFMHIQSEPGEGAEVQLYFPYTDLKAEEVPLSKAKKSPITDNKSTVLLVDDNVELLEMTEEILLSENYRVLKASGGQAALDIINSRKHFDLLFSDIAMPGRINGIKLAEYTKQHRPGCEILLTTGYTNEYAGQDVKTEFPVVQKPYDTDELIEKIQTMLHKAE